MTTVFDYDINSFEIEFYGIHPLNSEIVDYAIIKTNQGKVWYDHSNGIQLQYGNEYRGEQVNLNWDSEVIIKQFEYKDGDCKYNYIHIPIDEYTEESFFMQSTITDFGSVTFEQYTQIMLIVARALQLIKEWSPESSVQ